MRQKHDVLCADSGRGVCVEGRNKMGYVEATRTMKESTEFVLSFRSDLSSVMAESLWRGQSPLHE
jgi:hypothetical protein